MTPSKLVLVAALFAAGPALAADFSPFATGSGVDNTPSPSRPAASDVAKKDVPKPPAPCPCGERSPK